jgi:predicted ArsR family transcriptional regulator
MNESISVEKVKVKHHILHLLKMKGQQSAVDLAQQLEVSPMAIRQHLQNLQSEQLVTYIEQRQPVGRPLKFWHLTELAMQAFPDRHGDLTHSLLEGIVQVFGQSGLEDLIRERTQRQIEVYASKIDRHASWQEKVVTLAHLRTEEGYMAEAVQESSDVWLLRENHCSIATAAKTCSLFCSSEWQVFQALLGSEVNIERVEHLLNGDRCCAYRISLAAAQSTL